MSSNTPSSANIFNNTDKKNVKSQISAEKQVYFFFFFYSYMSYSPFVSQTLTKTNWSIFKQASLKTLMCTNTGIDQQHQYRPVGCWPNYDDYLRNPNFLQISLFYAYTFVLQLVLVIRTKVKWGFEGVNNFSDKGEASRECLF